MSYYDTVLSAARGDEGRRDLEPGDTNPGGDGGTPPPASNGGNYRQAMEMLYGQGAYDQPGDASWMSPGFSMGSFDPQGGGLGGGGYSEFSIPGQRYATHAGGYALPGPSSFGVTGDNPDGSVTGAVGGMMPGQQPNRGYAVASMQNAPRVGQTRYGVDRLSELGSVRRPPGYGQLLGRGF